MVKHIQQASVALHSERDTSSHLFCVLQAVAFTGRRRSLVRAGRRQKFSKLKRHKHPEVLGRPSKAVPSTKARPITFVPSNHEPPRENDHADGATAEHFEDEMIDRTPRTEAEKRTFQYYCPICFGYARTIMSTSSCCNQHVCISCALALSSASRASSDAHTIEGSGSFCECPYCGENFDPTILATGSPPQKYHDEDTVERQTPMVTSPVRIGDSFEDLKRKMLPFTAPTASTFDEPLLTREESGDFSEGEDGGTQDISLDGSSLFDQSFDIDGSGYGPSFDWEREPSASTASATPQALPVTRATATPGASTPGASTATTVCNTVAPIPEAEAFVRSVMTAAIDVS